MATKTLPRNIQRVERMKLQYNKYVERLENHPKHLKAANWLKRMRELIADIAATELRAQADEVEIQAKKAGVNIEVPLQKFGLREAEPQEA